MQTIIATSGYDPKQKLALTPLTLSELKALKGGECLQFLDIRGKVRNCKVNGKCRIWKRNLTRFEVPCKYGLREYFTICREGELFTGEPYAQTELPL